MASTPPTPENQGVIATALLSEDQTVRDAATVAAVGMTMGSGLLFEGSLLPSSLDPGQLRAEPHLVESLNSPSPSSLAVGDRQKTLWAFREVISLQASLALRASTRSAAACLAQLSRATSQSGGFFVLFSVPRDDQEEFRAAEANDPIEQIRSRLVPDLVRLAQAADDRLALLSLSLLRLDDGPSAAEVLETALASEDDERFRSALMGLSQAPTAGSIESIAATPMPEESWSRRRRRVLALEQVVASTKKQAVRQAALAAVSRFSHDENALVRSAALQVLRTNQQ
jgi:hypothetical protein